MLKYCVLFSLLISVLQVNAQQQDTLVKKNTTEKKESIKVKFQKTTKEIGSLFKDTTDLQPARKAVLRSAIIPGWGQARNGKWWKVPLVYGGFVGLGFVYNFNNQYFKEFLAESQYRKANPGTDPKLVYLYPQYRGISAEQIYSAKDFYRRNRDLTLYGSVLFYGVQMIDAYIDARLATFDVSDNLSMKIKPSIYIPSHSSIAYQSPVPMLTLKIKL
jgi:hypothetical protein